MSRYEDLNTVIQEGIVAVIRAPNSELLVDVAEAHDFARDRTMQHTGGIQVPRAEYRIVGREEIYLAGNPLERSAAEQALLSACDQLLAQARLLVDGIPRGEFPGLLAVQPAGLCGLAG